MKYRIETYDSQSKEKVVELLNTDLTNYHRQVVHKGWHLFDVRSNIPTLLKFVKMRKTDKNIELYFKF